MGIISNFILKTAVKNALVDVTEDIENFSRAKQFNSFGERVNYFFNNSSPVHRLDINAPWEINYIHLIIKNASTQNPSSYLINNNTEHIILVNLLCEWISGRGGDIRLVYSFFSGEKIQSDNDNVHKKIITVCRHCKTKNSISEVNLNKKPICGSCKKHLL